MHCSYIDIITKYLNLRHLQPRMMDWNEQKLKINNFCYKTFHQLNSLFWAFNLGSLRDFESGTFVRNFPLDLFIPIVEIAKKNNCYKFKFDNKNDDLNYKNLELLFIDLWDYRTKIDGILRLNGQIENPEGIYLYVSQQIINVNNIIKSNLENIDQLLGMLITPQRKEISIEELKIKYCYMI